MAMMKAERQRLILQRVNDDGKLLVNDFASELGLATDTVRKDLQELDRRGALQRVHGGAIRLTDDLRSFDRRLDTGQDVKTRLGAAVLDEVLASKSLFIDGGTTNYLFARQIPRSYRGTVITNSPAVALWLSDYDNVEVVIIPGVLNHVSKEAMGSQALEALQRLECDVVLLGISSLDPTWGISFQLLESTETKREIARAGRTVFSLVTAEKLDHTSTFQVGPCTLIDVMVTNAPEDAVRPYRARGVDVRCV